MTEAAEDLQALSDAELVARWHAIDWPDAEGDRLADEIERRSLDL